MGTIQGGKIIAKKLYQNCQVHYCPNPLAFPQALGEIQAKQLEDKEEEEPRIMIEEWWPISEIIVSWFILRLIKRYFSRPKYMSLIYVI
jgi:hypothetical protein